MANTNAYINSSVIKCNAVHCTSLSLSLSVSDRQILLERTISRMLTLVSIQVTVDDMHISHQFFVLFLTKVSIKCLHTLGPV